MTLRSQECREILFKISDYLDGELDATACDEIDRHCTQCASCTEIVEGLRQTIGLCRQVAAAPLPAELRQRALERVRQLLDSEGPGRQ
jgi:anti-sigma factor RsiW